MSLPWVTYNLLRSIQFSGNCEISYWLLGTCLGEICCNRNLCFCPLMLINLCFLNNLDNLIVLSIEISLNLAVGTFSASTLSSTASIWLVVWDTCCIFWRLDLWWPIVVTQRRSWCPKHAGHFCSLLFFFADGLGPLQFQILIQQQFFEHIYIIMIRNDDHGGEPCQGWTSSLTHRCQWRSDQSSCSCFSCVQLAQQPAHRGLSWPGWIFRMMNSAFMMLAWLNPWPLIHFSFLWQFFSKCCLLLFDSGARDAAQVDVRWDQEVSRFELPCFKFVPVLLHIKLQCLENNLWDATVALGEFPGKDVSFSSFVVKSSFHLSKLEFE